MIAAFLMLAVAVLPPEGPFCWKGKEVPFAEPVKFFRIVPMKEPKLMTPLQERYVGDDTDRLVAQFAKTRSAEDAFDIFRCLASSSDTNEFAAVSVAERDYLLRYAAAKGQEKALEFFDENGRLLSGLAFEYVYAQYRYHNAKRMLGPSPQGAPGYGHYSDTSIRPYETKGKLKELLDRYSMTARWFEDKLPFLEFTPKDCPTNEVPLLVYLPGSGEQGTNIIVQFNQRACLEKVVSAEFQKKHPCRFMIICLPDKANVNSGHGYPFFRDARSALYNDMILAYARYSDAPKVDSRRIYLTGLGSGGTIANGMMLDHPGRYAAVAPVWHFPYSSLVHPRIPGNWRFYNAIDPRASDNRYDPKRMKWYARTIEDFTENAISVGGDCSFQYVPRSGEGCWWNAVWSGDEIYDWLFSKTAPVGSREEF